MSKEKETTSSNCDWLFARIAAVEEQMRQAATRAGRNVDDIQLLPVTKKVDPLLVQAVVSKGYAQLAENYVQSAQRRMVELSACTTQVVFHLIGALQRNKAKDAVGLFDLIHSVDSPRLLAEIDKQAARKSLRQKILLQVNIAEDEQKAGCSPTQATALVEQACAAKHVSLQGLMTIGKFGIDKDARRAEFRALRRLRDALASEYRLVLPELSMGMSDDFVEAIEEGATMVRIGSAIFGARS